MLRVIDQAAASDVGRVRRANEDAYYVRAPLFVVADGMGGAQAGEVASRIASQAFAAGLDESLSPERRLANVVAAANREIHDKSVSDPAMQGMGTTLTAVLLGDGDLTVAHVGDSRAYRLRDGELTRLTQDHSVVGEMVRRGALSETEAERHPQRSILTRALGPEREVAVDTLSHAVRAGDVYLLCSDGLTAMVDEAAIAEAMGSGGAMRAVAERLIARANDAGGVDNITVVAFRVADSAGSGAAATTPAGEPAADVDDGSRTLAGAPPVAVPPASGGNQLEASPPGSAGGPPGSGVSPAGPRTPAGGNGHVPPELHSRQVAARRREQTRRPRVLLGVGVAIVVFLIAATGAVVGSLNIYFLGVDQHGLVTVYRGLPYEGPLALKTYTKDYVSTVPADRLPAAERKALLDHKLRTRGDAVDLIAEVEQRQLERAQP